MDDTRLLNSAEPRESRFGLSGLLRWLPKYGLLAFTAALIVAFSLLLPNTFPTAFTFRSILNEESVYALAALAVMVPMAANHFDLSVGYMLGMAQVLGMGLQSIMGLQPWLTVLLVLCFGACVGIVNGLLVTRAKIDSFIATLGTGTVVYGLNLWYTGGQEITGNLPQSFTNIANSPFGIPLPAVYVLVAGVTLWLVFEYFPLGRHLYVLGSNPRAAELNGISAKKNVTLAFTVSGVLASIAGLVLVSQLQVGESSVGPDYLLPSFTAALLGATTIKPGRVNVWGTILAVLLLSVAIAGLQQMGAQYFVQPLFDGLMLIIAVGLSGVVIRRRKERVVKVSKDDTGDVGIDAGLEGQETGGNASHE